MSWFLLVRASLRVPLLPSRDILPPSPATGRLVSAVRIFTHNGFDCQECFTIWASWLYKNPLVCPCQLWKNVFFSLYLHPLILFYICNLMSPYSASLNFWPDACVPPAHPSPTHLFLSKGAPDTWYMRLHIMELHTACLVEFSLPCR